MRFMKLKELQVEITDKFPILDRSLIIWKHYLAFSSLECEQDACVLYDYLTHPETGKFDDGLISQIKEKGEVRSIS